LTEPEPLKKGFPNCLQAGSAMVLPFLLPIALQYILPAYEVIIGPAEIIDMFWVSKQDEGCPGRDSQNPHRLAPSLMDLMFRYGTNR
jgi:hypothetical protein